MAEAFFKELAPKQYSAQSAGTVPSSGLNKAVVHLMHEIGVGMACQQPKLLSRTMLEDASVVVNMGCIDKEACPALSSPDISMTNWDIPDPKDRSYNDIRNIRDQIKKDVIKLIKTLEANR